MRSAFILDPSFNTHYWYIRIALLTYCKVVSLVETVVLFRETKVTLSRAMVQGGEERTRRLRSRDEQCPWPWTPYIRTLNASRCGGRCPRPHDERSRRFGRNTTIRSSVVTNTAVLITPMCGEASLFISKWPTKDLWPDQKGQKVVNLFSSE